MNKSLYIYSKRTKDNYLSHIKRFLESIGDKQIIHLNSNDFQKYLNNYEFTSISQQNQIINSIRFLYKEALNRIVQKIAGHSNIKTTEGYCHVSNNLLKNVHISYTDLLNSYGTPYLVIPAPGEGKMIELLWGKYKLYGGTQSYGNQGYKYFSVYPEDPQGPQGFWVGLMNNNESGYNKYFALGSQGTDVPSYEWVENANWVLKINDF